MAELRFEPLDPRTWPEVDLLYRQAAARHHPDKGGDTAKMARINEARARLLEAR